MLENRTARELERSKERFGGGSPLLRELIVTRIIHQSVLFRRPALVVKVKADMPPQVGHAWVEYIPLTREYIVG
jgi:hypothetical protein